jgi:hypothetical protein
LFFGDLFHLRFEIVRHPNVVAIQKARYLPLACSIAVLRAAAVPAFFLFLGT